VLEGRRGDGARYIFCGLCMDVGLVSVCDKDRHSRLWHLGRANLAMQQLACLHPNETERCVSFARDDAGYAEARGHPSHGAQQDRSGSLRMMMKRIAMCGCLAGSADVTPSVWSPLPSHPPHSL
jgi:hypothetical protein